MLRIMPRTLPQRALFHRSFERVSLPELHSAIQEDQNTCYCQKLNARLPSATDPLDSQIKLPHRTPNYNKHVLLLSPGDKFSEPWKLAWNHNLDTNLTRPYNAISKLRSFLGNSPGILINAIHLQNEFMPRPTENDEWIHFFVIPDMKLYRIKETDIEKFASFLNEGVVQAPKLSFQDYLGGKAKAPEQDREIHHQNLTKFQGETFLRDWSLVCGHYKRDAKCGEIVTDIITAFRDEKLFPESNLAIISHVGGHVFAGNVIFYKLFNKENERNKLDSLWFGKVYPHNLKLLCQNLENKKIIDEMYRGGISMN
ncbi:YML050W [Saccharomyces arboricola H-6]|uniref:Altered inheritance of mitochondria protein 32 n=1 Tax=Saccharomyces arboricola (strain H-6 / AS 2.3317 / CBS 10644) TaxID=1160507 RepID=J8Q4D2_SACAR|nr:YML050W [Saccharomyces arboricola H-6]